MQYYLHLIFKIKIIISLHSFKRQQKDVGCRGQTSIWVQVNPVYQVAKKKMLTVKAKHLPGSKSIQSFKRHKKDVGYESQSFRLLLCSPRPFASGLGTGIGGLKLGVVSLQIEEP
jgi:hypothetical protein